MSVYVCITCRCLMDIDELNCDLEAFKCPHCRSPILLEVRGFEEFLESLGYVGVNKICPGCREKLNM